MQATEADSFAGSSGSGTEKTRLRCAHYLPSLRLEGGGVARAVLDWK